MKLEKTACSDIGRRPSNQDSYLASSELGVFAVADGMGGYEGGEVASRLTVEQVEEFFQRARSDPETTWPFRMNHRLSIAENLVEKAMRLANRAVHSRRTGRLGSMGSTLVMLALFPGQAVIGHIGDSRIYRLRRGQWACLTRDHSLYEALKAGGSTDLPPLSECPFANVITRAVGMQPDVEPELASFDLEPDDLFLLCSDGLSGTLDDVSMAAILSGTPLPGACRALIEAALERGSRDNVTAVVVRVGAPVEA